MDNEAKEELERSLPHFTGTEAYHKCSGIYADLRMTDGVKYLCDKAGAYWLMDLIASYQPKCRQDEMLVDFQIWRLKVNGSEGKVTCERDTNDIAFFQDIPFTDFPLNEIQLYCIQNVVLLTSEY